MLTAFQQVEDELAALRILEQQAAVQDQAVKAANEAEQLILNQYKAGTVAYTARRHRPAPRSPTPQTPLTIRQSRLVASATLIQALGGGWSSQDLSAVQVALPTPL